MKQQDWTEQWRQRLENYEEPIGEDLWPAIEQRLGRKGRMVTLLRWVAGVAACGLLLIGVWALIGSRQEAEEQLLAQSVGNGAEDFAADEQETPEDSPETPQAPAPQTPNRQANHLGTSETHHVLTSEVHHVLTSEAQERSTPEPQEPLASKPQERPNAQGQKLRPSDPQQFRDSKTPKLKHSNRWALAVQTGNLMAQGGNTQTSPMLMSPSYMGEASAAMARRAPVYLSEYEESSEHQKPFTVGLTVRLQLGRHWWLSCGMDYSRLSSTFTRKMPSQTNVSKQRLHYLGVPLSAGYTWWDRPRLRAYVSSGAVALFNVDTQVSEGHLPKDRVQFALMASAGVEYRLIDNLSFYLEPGLRYYPDNGSTIQNAFKDTPLQPDWRIGLRLTLSSGH